MIVCRQALPMDAAVISRIFAESWKFAYSGIVEAGYLQNLREDHWVSFLKSGMQEGSLFCTVLDVENKPMGAAVARLSQIAQFPKDGEIVCLYLLPDAMGKGLGSVLLRYVEKQLLEQQYKSFVLDVLANNARAIAFYEKNGYANTGYEVETTLGQQTLLCKCMRKKSKAGIWHGNSGK